MCTSFFFFFLTLTCLPARLSTKTRLNDSPPLLNSLLASLSLEDRSSLDILRRFQSDQVVSKYSFKFVNGKRTKLTRILRFYVLLFFVLTITNIESQHGFWRQKCNLSIWQRLQKNGVFVGVTQVMMFCVRHEQNLYKEVEFRSLWPALNMTKRV